MSPKWKVALGVLIVLGAVVLVVLITVIAKGVVDVTTVDFDDPAYVARVLEGMSQIDGLQHDRLDEADSAAGVDWSSLTAAGSSTTLRQVLVVHRHGDRTPEAFAPRDPLANESFWALHGRGRLTNRGKARVHLLGRLMRARYDVFLNGSVNKRHVLSRSSGKLRCIESAQLFLASFLALDADTSRDAHQLVWDHYGNRLARLWQPVAVRSVPANMGAMLHPFLCNGLSFEHVDGALRRDYQPVMDALTSAYGYDFRYSAANVASAESTLSIERTYFPERALDERVRAQLGPLAEAANRVFGAYNSSERLLRLAGGLLASDMLANMKGARLAGAAKLDVASPKFVEYSAHDFTVAIALQLFEQWHRFPVAPDFASSVVVELHEDARDGVWFVRLFYLAHVPGPLRELAIERCVGGEARGRCTLERLEAMLAKYALASWLEWMRECGNDLASVDPYAAQT